MAALRSDDKECALAESLDFHLDPAGFVDGVL